MVHDEEGGNEYSSNERYGMSNVQVFDIDVSSLVQPRGGQAYFIHSRGNAAIAAEAAAMATTEKGLSRSRASAESRERLV